MIRTSLSLHGVFEFEGWVFLVLEESERPGWCFKVLSLSTTGARYEGHPGSVVDVLGGSMVGRGSRRLA